MVYVIAPLHIRPEKRASFLEEARSVIAHSSEEEAGLSYDLSGSITEPNAFVLVGRWSSREGLETHLATPHFQDWRRASAEYLVDRRVEVVHPERVEELRPDAGGRAPPWPRAPRSDPRPRLPAPMN